MEKIKQFFESEKGKDFLIVSIIILVGLASFELGRLSKESPQNSLKIEYSDQEANNPIIYQNSQNRAVLDKTSSVSNTIVNSDGKNFFASSRGKKYYPINCSAGKSIKQENRVYFSTREEAQKAGYELSSSCQ